jgi:hypothetical protein
MVPDLERVAADVQRSRLVRDAALAMVHELGKTDRG